MTNKTKISKIRDEIDKIDSKIQKLLSERTTKIKEINEIKKENKIKIIDKSRENEILNKTKTDFEKEVFKKIIKESRKLQKLL